MNFRELRNRLISSLWDYIGCPVILSNQVQPEAEPPFCIYTVTAPYIPDEYMKNGICGDGNFIDNVLGADYITHQIRENLYKIFIANKKIAYTDDGFALVAAGVFAALNRAVELHIIATDPEDDTGVYTVVIPKRADATDEQARNRQMPDIKWSAQLEGAVHSVKVNGTLRVTLNG